MYGQLHTIRQLTATRDKLGLHYKVTVGQSKEQDKKYPQTLHKFFAYKKLSQ